MQLRQVEGRPVLGFDLENRPLAYWFDGETTSEITAFAWKWLNEGDVFSMLLKPNGRFQTSWGKTLSDKDAYMKFRGLLAHAGLVFGHNIRRHDLPMFNAGLIRRSLPTLPPLMTTDTSKDLPKRRGLSYSLENLAAMYGLEGEKFSMSQPAWEEANRLSDGGLALAGQRVASDVLLQEGLRERLIELHLLKGPRTWTP